MASAISLEYLNSKNNNNNKTIKEKYEHCKNCGAILKSNKCDYCKTEYINVDNDKKIEYVIRGGIKNQI